jgi:hypothetical protein
MKDKLFKYGITIGLTSSLIGFIFLKTDLLTENYNNLIHIFYKLTFIISIIFLLTKSSFIEEKFDQILKVVGLIFLIIFGINLLKEFNVYEIGSVKTISYILFCSLHIMYTSHFLKKTHRNQLDYIKFVSVTLLFVCGFLNLFNLLPYTLIYIFGALFWVVVIGMLYINHKKENGIKKYVG